MNADVQLEVDDPALSRPDRDEVGLIRRAAGPHTGKTGEGNAPRASGIPQAACPPDERK